ncbi:CPBP family intramembrane metalloprotease [Aurantiacibacter sp. MUD11]|uniref:CPBP family intramembrane glutamic endopeptidase n=1 Tax=Aurantiacibacter sp. MUD11 TaxID=3003265 RepID=UPI0022AA2FB4|nr:CPBP family intramembrane glutamic endopeptidase [Aurantiacibacter sp. MUD11]WAT17497.1 CPBP family intramembrane metalloprotease [Aurantiacibacter sp. MUD11]
MGNPADTFRDAPTPTTLATKQPIGWLRFLLQFLSVVMAYLAGSTLPMLPALIAQVANGAEAPQLTSAIAAATAIVGMALALGVCWLWLRGEGRVREVFDLSAPNWRSAIAYAAIATAGTLAIFSFGTALVQAMGLPAPDPSFVLELVTESPAMFALWVIGVAWFAAGFGEELLWRGFLMDRLERLGGLRGRVWLVLVVQAVLFGMPHAYQGWGGVIVTGMVGLLLGWVRIMQRGNLWAVIIAHAAVDTIMMVLAYGGKLGWFVV